jgi:hypothetical protein
VAISSAEKRGVMDSFIWGVLEVVIIGYFIAKRLIYVNFLGR